MDEYNFWTGKVKRKPINFFNNSNYKSLPKIPLITPMPSRAWIKPVKLNTFNSKNKFGIFDVQPVKLNQFPVRTKREMRLIDRQPYGDKDRDGLMNWFDCRPMNRRMQDKLRLVRTKYLPENYEGMFVGFEKFRGLNPKSYDAAYKYNYPGYKAVIHSKVNIPKYYKEIMKIIKDKNKFNKIKNKQYILNRKYDLEEAFSKEELSGKVPVESENYIQINKNITNPKIERKVISHELIHSKISRKNIKDKLPSFSDFEDWTLSKIKKSKDINELNKLRKLYNQALLTKKAYTKNKYSSKGIPEEIITQIFVENPKEIYSFKDTPYENIKDINKGYKIFNNKNIYTREEYQNRFKENPEVLQFFEPKLNEPIKTFYHGTVASTAKKILEGGLKPGTETGLYMGTVKDKLQPEVYAAPDLERARGWAGRALVGKGQKIAPGETTKILKIDMPESAYNKYFVRRNTEKGGGEEVAFKEIPKEYISLYEDKPNPIQDKPEVVIPKQDKPEFNISSYAKPLKENKEAKKEYQESYYPGPVTAKQMQEAREKLKSMTEKKEEDIRNEKKLQTVEARVELKRAKEAKSQAEKEKFERMYNIEKLKYLKQKYYTKPLEQYRSELKQEYKRPGMFRAMTSAKSGMSLFQGKQKIAEGRKISKGLSSAFMAFTGLKGGNPFDAGGISDTLGRKTSEGMPSMGRGRPTGTFKPKYIPGIGFVNMHTYEYRALLKQQRQREAIQQQIAAQAIKEAEMKRQAQMVTSLQKEAQLPSEQQIRQIQQQPEMQQQMQEQIQYQRPQPQQLQPTQYPQPRYPTQRIPVETNPGLTRSNPWGLLAKQRFNFGDNGILEVDRSGNPLKAPDIITTAKEVILSAPKTSDINKIPSYVDNTNIQDQSEEIRRAYYLKYGGNPNQ